MNDHPMMKCGHAANATCNGKPSCAICAGTNAGANEVDDNAPSLVGRIASCSYRGSCATRREKCTHYGRYDEKGHSIADSNTNLPFFEYQGPGSPYATDFCGTCGFPKRMHLQRYKMSFKVRRDWFAHKNITQDNQKEEHFKSVKEAEEYAKAFAEEILNRQGNTKFDDDTRIHEVTVASVVPIKTPPFYGGKRVCNNFVERGPCDTDKYYCGCMGWD